MHGVSSSALQDLVVRTMQSKPDYSAGDMVKLVTKIVQRGGAFNTGGAPESPQAKAIAPGSNLDVILQLMRQCSEEEIAILLKTMFKNMAAETRAARFQLRTLHCTTLQRASKEARTVSSGMGVDLLSLFCVPVRWCVCAALYFQGCCSGHHRRGKSRRSQEPRQGSSGSGCQRTPSRSGADALPHHRVQ